MRLQGFWYTPESWQHDKQFIFGLTIFFTLRASKMILCLIAAGVAEGLMRRKRRMPEMAR
jgi:hypothetical protein